MKHAADRRQIVCLVRPRQRETWKPRRQLIAQFTKSLAKNALREKKQRRAVLRRERVDRNALESIDHTNHLLAGELVHAAKRVPHENRPFVPRPHAFTVFAGGRIPLDERCAYVSMSAI